MKEVTREQWVRMSKIERRAYLQEHARNMIDFFKGRQLPAGIIRLNKSTSIVDADKMVDTQIAIMEDKMNDPFCKVFTAAATRLKTFKTYLENEQSQKTDL